MLKGEFNAISVSRLKFGAKLPFVAEGKYQPFCQIGTLCKIPIWQNSWYLPFAAAMTIVEF